MVIPPLTPSMAEQRGHLLFSEAKVSLNETQDVASGRRQVVLAFAPSPRLLLSQVRLETAEKLLENACSSS